jgi:hypothetical protein
MSRIFISSTAADLEEHRASVSEALRRLGQQTIQMEVFGARPNAPLSECCKLAASADAVVVIVAHRYGWVPSEGEGGDGIKSITWYEVKAAVDAHRPIFSFIVKEGAGWVFLKEQDRLGEATSAEEASAIWQSVQKLKEFKSYLSSIAIRDTFDTPTDLSNKVITSLANWIVENQSQPSANAEDAALAVYRVKHTRRYEAQEWTRRAIQLEVRDGAGHTLNARTHLLQWAKGEGPTLTFLIGDFGSGKSGLIQWLARTLVLDLTCHLPIVIPLGRGRAVIPQSINQLISIADPAPPPIVFERQEPIVLLLDGLDELIGPVPEGRTSYQLLLSAILELVPPKTRVLLTSRTAAFEPISGGLVTALSKDVGANPFDKTEEALESIFGGGSLKHQVLTLCDLNTHLKDEYLSQTETGGIWKQLRTNESYAQLAQRPFMLRLLEKALPYLSQTRVSIELDTLYDVAVRAWLKRDSYSCVEDIDKIIWRLVDLARSHGSPRLTFGHNNYDHILIHAGLLRESQGRFVEFAHYSLFEYFFAKAIYNDLLEYDARLLAGLDLIGGYNINRFLVPMLRKTMPESGRPISTTTFVNLLGGKTNAYTGLVTRIEYNRFTTDTRWRQGIGHGIHPDLMADDGTPFLSATDATIFPAEQIDAYLVVNEVTATSVSWYDAVQYCRWLGGRLPTFDELSAIAEQENDQTALYEWSGEWFDEPRAHMFVCHVGCGSAHSLTTLGVNPDFRHSKLGFRVILNSSLSDAK